MSLSEFSCVLDDCTRTLKAPLAAAHDIPEAAELVTRWLEAVPAAKLEWGTATEEAHAEPHAALCGNAS